MGFVSVEKRKAASHLTLEELSQVRLQWYLSKRKITERDGLSIVASVPEIIAIQANILPASLSVMGAREDHGIVDFFINPVARKFKIRLSADRVGRKMHAYKKLGAAWFRVTCGHLIDRGVGTTLIESSKIEIYPQERAIIAPFPEDVIFKTAANPHLDTYTLISKGGKGGIGKMQDGVSVSWNGRKDFYVRMGIKPVKMLGVKAGEGVDVAFDRDAKLCRIKPKEGGWVLNSSSSTKKKGGRRPTSLSLRVPQKQGAPDCYRLERSLVYDYIIEEGALIFQLPDVARW